MKKRHWFFIGAILVLVLVGLAARFLPTSSLIRGVTKMKALSFEGPLLWLKGTGMVFGIILGVVLVLGILGGISSSIVFWVLAPTNRFFTFIKEGTAKIVVRGDQFEKALMRWEGHDFAGGLGVDRWTIVASQIPKPKPRFG